MVETRVSQSSPGLTLVEVLIAVTVLGIGILALVGSSSMITRMIGRGKVETQAALAASGRMEMLRAAARSTSPPCLASAFSSGGPVPRGAGSESWVVSPFGRLRRVSVTVTYLTVSGPRSAVLETAVPC
jgi:prepilin-type N-terminal cleavage/methylation domain-containing protein